MQYCPTCHTKFPDEDVFCMHDGMALVSETPIVEPSPMQPMSKPLNKSPSPANPSLAHPDTTTTDSSVGPALVFLFCLLLGVLGIATYIRFLQQPTAKTVMAQSTPSPQSNEQTATGFSTSANAFIPTAQSATPKQSITIPTSMLTATASSSIRKMGTRASVDFTPEQVLDGDYRTNWQEDAPGSGIGEWLQLSLSHPHILESVRIRNGYADTNDSDYGNLFLKNNRVRELYVNYSNGTHYTVTLTDTPDWQTFQLPSQGGITWARFSIGSVYPGSKYDDTCISDISLSGIALADSTVTQHQEAAQSTAHYYTVQVASRSNYQEALAFSQKIPNSTIYTKKRNNLTWYAITVGQFVAKDEASAFKSRVISNYAHVGTPEDVPKAFVTYTSKFAD